jgi:hypothetical protein
LGERASRRSHEGPRFFRAAHARICERVEIYRKHQGILRWKTPYERERAQDELDVEINAESDEDRNDDAWLAGEIRLMGYRSPTDELTSDEQLDFLLWIIAEGRPSEFDHISEHWNELDIIRAIAFRKNKLYLELEKPRETVDT